MHQRIINFINRNHNLFSFLSVSSTLTKFYTFFFFLLLNHFINDVCSVLHFFVHFFLGPSLQNAWKHIYIIKNSISFHFISFDPLFFYEWDSCCIFVYLLKSLVKWNLLCIISFTVNLSFSLKTWWLSIEWYWTNTTSQTRTMPWTTTNF